MISLQDYKNSKSINGLVNKLFESKITTHLYHLKTKSYSVHKALQKFYETIEEFTDSFVETYQGQYGLLKIDTISCGDVDDIEKYLEDSVKIFTIGRDSIKDSHLKNIMDEIITLTYQTIYKIKYLK